MKRTPVRTTLGVAALMAAGSLALTAPQPSEVPVSWELDLNFEHPQAIQMRLPGQERPATFWFMRYSVTNHTGADQIFVPNFTLYTDTGQVLPAGRKVPGAVFEKIKQTYNDPLLKETSAMTGKLLEGDDNAREGVAIWTDFDPDAGAFDLFVGGLSGETADVVLPKPVTLIAPDADGNPQTVTKEQVVLAKTLQLSYGIAGEAAARPRTAVKLLAKRWVMR